MRSRAPFVAALHRALVLSCILPAFAQFDPPPAYYDSAIGTTGANLKAALHNAIKAHTVLPYTFTATDTWDAIKILDEAPGDSASVVLIYSGLTNLKANQYAGGVGTGKWDREHLWPQSFGLIAISAGSRAKTDLFNLRAIDYTAVSVFTPGRIASVTTSRGGLRSHPKTSAAHAARLNASALTIGAPSSVKFSLSSKPRVCRFCVRESKPNAREANWPPVAPHGPDIMRRICEVVALAVSAVFCPFLLGTCATVWKLCPFQIPRTSISGIDGKTNLKQRRSHEEKSASIDVHCTLCHRGTLGEFRFGW